MQVAKNLEHKIHASEIICGTEEEYDTLDNTLPTHIKLFCRKEQLK